MKRAILFLLVAVTLVCFLATASAQSKKVFLIHLKTGLKKDDAQICVAYNMMWAAVVKGYKVDVLVDADAINTYKVGWRGKDSIQGYKMPESLRRSLSEQFRQPLDKIPKTYGEFLQMLHTLGVKFYINRAYLMVSKIGTPDNPLQKISNKFFVPVSLEEMVALRAVADLYMVY